MPPQFFWLWSPIHFDEALHHAATRRGGTALARERQHRSGGRPDEAAAELIEAVDHRAGTRAAPPGAEIMLTPHGRAPVRSPSSPSRSRCAASISDPRGHGQWKGPEVVDGVTWMLADLDPMDPRHLHVQQLCRARCGSDEGLGILEQLVIGPHAPSGFTSILDPAP
jgi:hypothetical protein